MTNYTFKMALAFFIGLLVIPFSCLATVASVRMTDYMDSCLKDGTSYEGCLARYEVFKAQRWWEIR